jgi:hypothetical protein
VSHVIQTYTHPVSGPSMTRAASRSAFATALGYRKAIALIPNSDVVVTDGTPGFRTWSPPV